MFKKVLANCYPNSMAASHRLGLFADSYLGFANTPYLGLSLSRLYATIPACSAGRPGRLLPLSVLLYFWLLTPIFSIAQNTKQQWVDSVFQKLSTNEKISQLFMLPISSYSSKAEQELLISQIKKLKPGSILITRGGPVSHVALLNRLQAASKTPLLTAINAEWGLEQSLDSTMSFAKPLQLGSIHNDSLVFAAGKEIGRQMKILGLHLNFAPNADINIDDDLYPTTLRYFSDDKEKVTAKSIQFIKGLQSEKILAAAKHLTNQKKDRHLAIKDSSIVFNINKLDTISFYPFQKLIESGVNGIVTSHLDYVIPGKKKPVLVPVSDVFVTELIKTKLGFKGLVIAEMPYFRKVSNKTKAGEAERLAFEIGNDLLVDPINLSTSIKKISKTLKNNPKLKAQLDTSVKKILSAKFDAGLSQNKLVDADSIPQRLNSANAKVLQYQLAEASPTLLNNSESLIPIASFENNSFASISIGKSEVNEFNHYLSKYADFKKHSVQSLKDTLGLRQKIKDASYIVLALFPSAKGLTHQLASVVKKLALTHRVVICSFGDPEDLKFFKHHSTLIASYSDDDLTQKITAQIIFGALSAKGELPISIGDDLKINQGLNTDTLARLSYALPELAGMDSQVLLKIKTIMQEAIDLGATPGCQVLIAKDGKVVYEQSAGWFTYDKKIPVTDEAIYDLASMTKVSATLQAVMFMHEKGLIDINKKISVYLPELKESNKKDFTIKDILTHQAGLWPFLPFWAQTVKDSTLMKEYYQTKKSEEYPFPVADSIFAHKSMKDSLWHWIIKAKIREKVPRTAYDYRYSDMGFYVLQHLAEKILNQPMQDFLQKNIYEPIGAYTVGYLPREKFDISLIAPTENDKLFRRRLLIGYVHDQGAAMHGGIAGHAGLFGSANDMAKLGQMWLKKGRYGKQQFFKPETLELFTEKQYADSRRGLGWDKPVIGDSNGPTSIYASPKTFGHTGFTGTSIWVDPEFNIVYVFLSNRVYPVMTNNKILNANIRPRIQDVIYLSIFEYSKNQKKH